MPDYSFSVDVPHSLVSITMGGFFRPSDVAEFIQSRNEAHLRLRCPRNQHLTLVDIREMKIQSQDAVAAFQDLFAAPDYRSRRIAIVVNSSLARSQVKRAATGRGAEFFESLEAAKGWLLLDRMAATMTA